MNPSREHIEARITALLLGELPEAEAELLRWTIAQDANLQKLHDELKSAIVLVRETVKPGAGQVQEESAPLKLSDPRRAQLLAHFKTPRPGRLSWLRRIEAPLTRNLVAIAMILMVVGGIAVLSIPNFVKSRATSQASSINNNLRQIDAAKNEWALENHKLGNDVPTADDLSPYLKGGALKPVTGETYVLGSVSESPAATVSAQQAQSLGGTYAKKLPEGREDKVRVSLDDVMGADNSKSQTITATLSGAPATSVRPEHVLPNGESVSSRAILFGKTAPSSTAPTTVTLGPEPVIAPPPARIALPSEEPAPMVVAGGLADSGIGGNSGVISQHIVGYVNVPQDAKQIPPSEYTPISPESPAPGAQSYAFTGGKAESVPGTVTPWSALQGRSSFQSSALTAVPPGSSLDYNATTPSQSGGPAGGVATSVVSGGSLQSANEGRPLGQQQLSGVSAASSEDASTERQLIEAQRQRELSQAEGGHSRFSILGPLGGLPSQVQSDNNDLPTGPTLPNEANAPTATSSPTPSQNLVWLGDNSASAGSTSQLPTLSLEQPKPAPAQGAYQGFFVDDDPHASAPAPTLDSQQLQMINQQMIDLEKAYKGGVGELQELPPIQQTNRAKLYDVLPQMVQDDTLNGLLSKLHQAQQKSTTLTNDFTVTSGLRSPVQPSIDELNREIDDRVGGIMAGLASQVDTKKAELDALVAQTVESAKQSAMANDKRLQPYYDAKIALAQKRRMHDLLYSKLEAEKLDLALPKTSMVQLTDPAVPITNQTFWQKLNGQYQSTARLKVENDTTDISGINNSLTYEAYDPRFIQTTKEIIRSDTVLSNVVDALRLDEIWANGGKLTKKEAVNRLKRQLDVQPVRNTKLLQISATGENPQEAAQIANTVAEAYKNYRRGQRKQLTDTGVATLEEQFADQEKDIESAQEKVERLRKELLGEEQANTPAEYLSEAIPIRYGKADDIANALNQIQLHGPTKIIPNKFSNSLLLYATREDMDTIKAAVAKLDTPANDAALPKTAPNAPIPQPEVLTSSNAFSTFSLNVSDVSFKLAAASLEKGRMPDAASIRSEEFINAFNYRDPEAAPGQPLAFAANARAIRSRITATCCAFRSKPPPPACGLLVR